MFNTKKIISSLMFILIAFLAFNCNITNVTGEELQTSTEKTNNTKTDIPEVENGWGPDSVQAVRCHSIYRGDLQIGNIEDAYPFWRCNYKLAPGSTLHIYVDGVRILREFINNSTNDDKKEAFIDTLMMLYDDRIKYFGNEGYVLGRKGLDLLRFRPSEIEMAFEILDRSIELQNFETEYTIPHTYMLILTRLYRTESINRQDFINKYQTINEIVNYNITSNENFLEHWIQARENVQQIVSRILDCNDLIEIYTAQFKNSGNDIETLKFITSALENNRCTSNEFYLKAALQLYKIEPTAQLAANIAVEKAANNKNNDAIRYYNEAIKMEKNNSSIAQYYMQVASIYRNSESFNLAKEAALNASKHRPDWGLPHLFIGTLYVLGADECADGFKKEVIYIIAVNKYQYAKSIDPSIAKDADELIERFSKHFPKTETAFFHGYREGDRIEIGCWINESASLRLRQ